MEVDTVLSDFESSDFGEMVRNVSFPPLYVLSCTYKAVLSLQSAASQWGLTLSHKERLTTCPWTLNGEFSHSLYINKPLCSETSFKVYSQQAFRGKRLSGQRHTTIIRASLEHVCMFAEICLLSWAAEGRRSLCTRSANRLEMDYWCWEQWSCYCFHLNDHSVELHWFNVALTQHTENLKCDFFCSMCFYSLRISLAWGVCI